MRLTDPRRFGAMLWLRSPAESHVLLRGLGLEPLEAGFDGEALQRLARGRRVAVKHFLMNGRLITGQQQYSGRKVAGLVIEALGV